MSTFPTQTAGSRRLRLLPRSRLVRRIVWSVEILLLLAVLAVLAATLYLRHALHASLPDRLGLVDGSLRVGGIAQPVTVTRDEHAVPSIHAFTLDDLLFTQGYITASDRLWQMDVLRRHASGELAELLGPSLVDHDRQQRYLRLRAAAERALAALPPAQLHQLQAYSRGVNAFIAAHPHALPVEFAALHYQPAPWSPRDCLLVALVMSQDLTTSFPEKLNREALSAELPAGLIADMYPVGSWRDQPPSKSAIDLTLPAGEIEEVPLDESQSSLRAAPHDLLARNAALSAQLCDGCRAGSNNWVVAASRSATGAPLLSNDMHLSLSAPDIWYEAALHLNDGSLDVAGFTLPGVPFVLVGRNRHVAWGFTNTGADVQDVLIEHLRSSAQTIQFESAPNVWSPVAHRTEVIHVRAGSDVTLDILATFHAVGSTTVETPIISPLYKSERRAIALLWNIYDPANVTAPFLAIDSATDAASLVGAFSGFGSPSQNLVYADSLHIGYHALGRVPVRGPAIPSPRPPAPGFGPSDRPEAAAATPSLDYTVGSPISNVPVDALDASQLWSGYIPYDRLPAVLDPPSGVIATANARITPNDYPYRFTDDWVDPYRVERIRKLLDVRSGLTPKDMLAVQTDVHSDIDRIVAERLAYAIDHASPQALAHDARRLRQAADLLRGWQGDVTQDSPAASIAVATRSALWPLLLSAQLRRRGITDPHEIDETVRLYTWQEKNTALESLLDHQPARWLPPWIGSWNDLLTLAVDQVLRSAPRDLSAWRYGRYHPVEIAHPVFGSQTLLSSVLGTRTGTGLQPNGGDTVTVKVAGLHFGPSERFTADLSDPDDTFANLTTGESGNPSSPFYLDHFDAWWRGNTFPLPLEHPHPLHTLLLQPE